MRIAALIALLLASTLVHAAIKIEPVEYVAGGVKMKGTLAYDDAVTGKRPGVLVVHEWWGHNQYSRYRAKLLAEMGYTALAVDMYGDGKTAEHPKEAGEFSAAVNKDPAARKARFAAAKDFLAKQPSVDAANVAALGYCFGGGVVLNMAREGIPLKAVISYHGALAADKPARKGAVKAKLLVFTGAADPMAPAEAVKGFEKEMKAAKADFRVVSYPGVKHAFTNPMADRYAEKFDLPLAFDKAADEDSWKQTGEFLKSVFSVR